MKKSKRDTLTALNGKIEAQQSEIKLIATKLAMSSAVFLHIIGRSLDGVVILDQANNVVYANEPAIKLFDCNIADLLGKPLDLNLETILLDENIKMNTELPIANVAGKEMITKVSVFKTEWNNEPCLVVNFRYIAEQKQSEKTLEFMATHDYLTSLPNRNYFETQMSKAIKYASEHKQHMALIYLDLDDFKQVNDTMGHNVADNLLKKISSLLLQNIRQGDTLVRLGGDEFAIILHSLRKPHYASIVSQNILKKLDEIHAIDGQEVYISASVGIAVYPFCGTNTVELLKNADTAMYAAKTSGKSQYRFFTAELSQQTEHNIQIINGLRHAIRREELQLKFQPIINTKHLACSGFEALLRWHHPQLGLILPETFLPYAEVVGAILPLGRWIFQQALDAYSKLNLDELFFISINMSATEFTATDVGDFIISSMKKRAIPPNKLIIELTETVIMKNPIIVAEKMKSLTDMGVRIAIDDYGIGYSSLSLLKQLPIEILKIDKAFVTDIGKNLNDTIIVKSTIQLAHNLGIKVIAEGVETEEQFTFLQEHGCDYMQGYYFSKPLDFDELTNYIHQLNAPL